MVTVQIMEMDRNEGCIQEMAGDAAVTIVTRPDKKQDAEFGIMVVGRANNAELSITVANAAASVIRTVTKNMDLVGVEARLMAAKAFVNRIFSADGEEGKVVIKEEIKELRPETERRND